MSPFRDVMALWPDIPTMAREVGAPVNTVREWWRVESIPASWFVAVVRAASARALHHITVEDLALRAEHRRVAKAQSGGPSTATALRKARAA